MPTDHEVVNIIGIFFRIELYPTIYNLNRVTIWGSSVICHPTRFICHPIWSDEQMTDHLTRWSVHPSDLDVKFIYQLYISKSLILYVFKCALQIYIRPKDRFRRPIFTSPWRNCLDRNFVNHFSITEHKSWAWHLSIQYKYLKFYYYM